MNLGACVIFDGRNLYVGQTSGFMIPRRVSRRIRGEGIQLDEAWRREGLTNEERIGYGRGVIDLLSNGILNREQYLTEAVRNAIIHLLNKDLFSQQQSL